MAVYKATPTKANLLKFKASLEFAKKGYELLDRKRTVLIREMMSLIDKAGDLQEKIDNQFQNAYHSLQLANISMGTDLVESIANSMKSEDPFDILFKSVMGVEMPMIKSNEKPLITQYGFYRTNVTFDQAVLNFVGIRRLIYELAEVENSVYRLAMEIKKTQKRANALNKIQIPKYENIIKYIYNVLEEKDREDFFRLKKVKGRTNKTNP
ncbi:V-type ATP synthase subunit D [Tissierella creatinini]|nr:V-type ATP synthase subunit D [Tissierella creatinini]TJX66341.1 V-type ATP synthase subunit D [Soehngenia saccharolytica]